jgi:hypothetical protein
MNPLIQLKKATPLFLVALGLVCFGLSPKAQAVLPSPTPKPSGQSVNVLTQHNDNARTGANLSETQLNTSNVGSGQFGMLFSLKVDGQIYAQPLYVSNLRFPNRSVHNVVYVSTMHNSVYAFDADKASDPLWVKNLGTPVVYNFMPMVTARGMLTLGKLTNLNCAEEPPTEDVHHNIEPEIGITSTPVIDLSSNTIYVVSKTTEDDGFAYRLHALDLLTGNERPGSPARIGAQVAGNAKGSNNGTLYFNSQMHLQRPGLLLANARVYIAFGAHQDTQLFHGWILAYDARTLRQTNVFTTTPDGEKGGIWQSGNGLASDESGNIYLMVGNGSFDGSSGGRDFGDSFIKLSPDLTVLDWFTPADFKDMIDHDIDLGSAGPLLLPRTSLLVGGGKKGKFYLLNRNDMGHLEDGLRPGDHSAEQVFQASSPPDPVLNNCGWDYHHIHGSPVTWDSPRDGRLVYVWAERDKLKAFRFDTGTMRFPSVVFPWLVPTAYQSKMEDPDPGFPEKSMPGGFLSISANGSASGTGILWASLPFQGDAIAALQPGILRAFDAANLNALWCGCVGTFPKFLAPTIANGKVYLGTFDNHLNVYGNGAHPPFGGNNANLGGYMTKSSPFVSNGYVYFQGKGSGDKDDRLYKVNVDNPNGDNTWLGGYKTKSSPFVSNGYVYFQGKGSGDKDDRLYKVNVDNPNGDNTWLGGYKTKSSPFVSNGYVYFQGGASADDKLMKVSITNPNGDNTWLGGYKTKSSPFVSNGYVYFQGKGSGDKDDRLYKVNVDNPNGDNTWLGGYKTKSSPFVSNGYVYFQGKGSGDKDDRLYKVNVDNPNGDNTWLGGYKTKSSPFVATSPLDGTDYVFFRGTDFPFSTLWRVSADGTGLASPNCGNFAITTPFVDGKIVFFQGVFGRLLQAWAYE